MTPHFKYQGQRSQGGNINQVGLFKSWIEVVFGRSCKIGDIKLQMTLFNTVCRMKFEIDDGM